MAFGQLNSRRNVGPLGRRIYSRPPIGSEDPNTTPQFDYDNGMCFLLDPREAPEEEQLEFIKDYITKWPEVLEDDYLGGGSQSFTAGPAQREIAVVFWQQAGVVPFCQKEIVYGSPIPHGMTHRMADFSREFHAYRGVPHGQAAMDDLVANKQHLMQKFVEELKVSLEADFWQVKFVGLNSDTPDYFADDRFVIQQSDVDSWTRSGYPSQCCTCNNGDQVDHIQAVYQANASDFSQYSYVINVILGCMGCGGGSPSNTLVGPRMINNYVSVTEGAGTPNNPLPGVCSQYGQSNSSPLYYRHWSDPNAEGANTPFLDCEAMPYCPVFFAATEPPFTNGGYQCALCTDDEFLQAHTTPPFAIKGNHQDCYWDHICPTADLEQVMRKNKGSLYNVAAHELGHVFDVPTPKRWSHEIIIGGRDGSDYGHAGFPPYQWMVYPCIFNDLVLNPVTFIPEYVPGVATGPDSDTCLWRPPANTTNGMNTVNGMGYSMPWTPGLQYGRIGDVGCEAGPEVAFAFVNGWLSNTYLHEIVPNQGAGMPWAGTTELWLSAWDILHIDKTATSLDTTYQNQVHGIKELAIRTRMSVQGMPFTAPNQHMYITFFGRGHCDSRTHDIARKEGILFVQWGPWAVSYSTGAYAEQNTCPTFERRNLIPLSGWYPDGDAPQDGWVDNYVNSNEINLAPFTTTNSAGDPQTFPGWQIRVIDEKIDRVTRIRTAVKLRITDYGTLTEAE